MKRVASAAGVVVLGPAGLAACGGGNGYGSGSSLNWAPATGQAGGTAKLATASVGDLGTVVVDGNGRKQLTLGGMPLYLFAQDSQSSQAKGQAVGGVWWVVGADGKKITTQPGGSGNGNGY